MVINQTFSLFFDKTKSEKQLNFSQLNIKYTNPSIISCSNSIYNTFPTISECRNYMNHRIESFFDRVFMINKIHEFFHKNKHVDSLSMHITLIDIIHMLHYSHYLIKTGIRIYNYRLIITKSQILSKSIDTNYRFFIIKHIISIF